MEEALERIQEWYIMGDDKTQLDLSNLGLTELPDLPSRLRSLNCSDNYLTSLLDTPLPISLVYLDCINNRLTSLPATLPSRLRTLDCSDNELKFLPKSLPIRLVYLNCKNNRLTCLPTILPSWLRHLDCSNNNLSKFPETLPNGLEYLNCSYNYRLHTISDTLPEGLIYFSFDETPLNLEADNSEVEEYNARRHRFIDECYITREFLPYRVNRISKKRTVTRCTAIKEALMACAWHPCRLAAMIERFVSVPQWNHEFRKYGTFDFTAVDEVL